ncbi:MAG: hypothetical protein ACTSYY_13725 [Promethearchaeota archaeon]
MEKVLQEINSEFINGNSKNMLNKIPEAKKKIIHSQKDLIKTQNPLENGAKTIGNIQKHSAMFFQGPAELNALISESELKRVIHNDPWEINIENALNNFKKRMYENSDIKFRIGGRLIYSASKIVHAKSNMVIKESHETQDELNINELEGNEFDELDEFDDLDGNNEYDENTENYGKGELRSANLNNILAGLKQQNDITFAKSLVTPNDIALYKVERDRELARSFSTYPFYSEDRNGNRFIAPPIRKIYRRINLDDLGKALIKTLHYQIKSSNRRSSELSRKNLASKILPENILKKAEEERALVEFHIDNMLKKIQNIFKEDPQPISFISLILTPDTDGIVRTLLYLLQLVNRKQVELWQIVDDQSNDNNIKESAGIDIFITPIKSG